MAVSQMGRRAIRKTLGHTPIPAGGVRWILTPRRLSTALGNARKYTPLWYQGIASAALLYIGANANRKALVSL